MTGELYAEIITKHLAPFAADKYDFQCTLQQDNDSKHSSWIAREALDEVLKFFKNFDKFL